MGNPVHRILRMGGVIHSEDYPYSDAYEFIKSVIKADFRKTIEEEWGEINLLEEVDAICMKTYTELTEAEKTKILKAISKNLKIEVDEDFNAKIIIE